MDLLKKTNYSFSLVLTGICPCCDCIIPKKYWIVQLDFKILLQEFGTDCFALFTIYSMLNTFLLEEEMTSVWCKD